MKTYNVNDLELSSKVEFTLLNVPQILFDGLLLHCRGPGMVQDNRQIAFLEEKRVGFPGVIRLYKNTTYRTLNIFYTKDARFDLNTAIRICSLSSIIVDGNTGLQDVQFTNYQGKYSDLGEYVKVINSFIREFWERIDRIIEEQISTPNILFWSKPTPG